MFCETEENKKMLDKYIKIIDEIKDQILFVTEDVSFIMNKYFMRFRFTTNDNLPYNQNIDAAVCLISISSVFQQGLYYSQIELQDCFYENCDYDY